MKGIHTGTGGTAMLPSGEIRGVGRSSIDSGYLNIWSGNVFIQVRGHVVQDLKIRQHVEVRAAKERQFKADITAAGNKLISATCQSRSRNVAAMESRSPMAMKSRPWEALKAKTTAAGNGLIAATC